MAASQVKALTEEVTAIVMNARPERGDRVSQRVKRELSLRRKNRLFCFCLKLIEIQTSVKGTMTTTK